MKVLGIVVVMCMFGWWGAIPAAAQGCCHHNHQCGPQARRSPAPSGQSANLQTVEGKIAEVDYLAGATADSGMVEVRVQAGGQAQLVRLAPAGFLKQGGLHLREGDVVVVKGFPVSGMEGDLVVATEVHKGDVSLSLRDTQGRPAW